VTILEFKQNLTGGGARANQFRVDLTFPMVATAGAEAGRKSQFLCTAASMPGSTIGVAPVYYRGREVKLPGERTFQNWQITIINDTDFAIRNAFEGWMNVINDVAENSGITNPNLITSQMYVTQMDRNNEDLKKYTFIDCWPVNMSDIQLSFDANDRVEDFTVELAYAYWLPE
jgi:hypothetical protein